MSLSSKEDESQNPLPSIRLLSDPPRIPVEQIVFEHKGRRWSVKDGRDMNDFASHPCAILSDDSYAVFVKLTDAV